MSDSPINLNELGDKIQFKTEEVGITLGNVFQTGFGIFAVAVGAVCGGVGISIMAEEFQVGWLLFTSLLGVLPLGTGVYLMRDSAKKARLRREEMLERKIVKSLLRQNGTTTSQQMAIQLALPLPVAEKKLEQLYGKGMLNVQISDSGVLYYELSEAMKWDRKRIG